MFSRIFGKKETEDVIEEKEELREKAEETESIAEQIEVKKIPETKQKIDVKIKEKKINAEEKEKINPKKVEPKTKKISEPSRIESRQEKSERKENKISVIINKPVSSVFEFTTNPKNTPLWIEDIISEETNEFPIRLGTEYKNVNKKSKWTVYTVVNLEKNVLFQLKQKDNNYSVCYEYESLPGNRTKLVYTEWVDNGELAEPFSIVTLEKLKEIIEKPIDKPAQKPVEKQTEKPIVKPHFQEVEEKRSERIEKTVIAKPSEDEHKGFFTKITETFTKIQISEEKFEELFWDLEVVLLENNVAVEVIEKIKRDLKKELMNGKVSRKGVEDLILSTLRQSITELFDVEKIDLIQKIKDKRKNSGHDEPHEPYIIAVIGVNGSGKTTSIAKLAHKFQKNGLKIVLAASDTFRAAAIQQLEEHANNLNVKMIKHDYNSDPAAVAFDAIKYAEAKDIDVVIIDTAGRLHSNTNLMRELEKVIRVCKPDIKIFVGESITGNDCVEQAKEFDKAVGIDAIILAKADVDDKGGAAISVSYILQRPILYLGTGQTYDDLKEFDSKLIIESLEL